MKKFLAFICLVIATVAVFTPCCLEDNCGNEQYSQQSSSSDNNEEGSCSPFFACASCNGFTPVLDDMEVAAPTMEPLRHNVAEFRYLVSNHSRLNWQPPRFA